MFYRMLLKMWLLPPLINIVLIVFGLLILHRYRKIGLGSCIVGVVSLLLLSMPPVSHYLLKSIEVAEAIKPVEIMALTDTAIVVLGAGQVENAEEYAQAQPDHNAVARLTYGAYLHKHTGLPLLLTGGKPSYSKLPHAKVQANYMQRHLQLTPTWLETQSRTTWENASEAAKILRPENIHQIVLVTQSVHMKRSILLFEAAGFKVIPAPIELSLLGKTRLQWFPTAKSLYGSQMVMHELLGCFWYWLNPPV